MINVSLALSEFALPSPRRGSIDIHSGFGRGAEIGQEIHARVQAERALAFSDYRSEVLVEHDFEIEDIVFHVRGRMDGIFDRVTPRIEEIKSTFNIFELFRKLKGFENEHPYCLQLRTYGYFYWLKHGTVPELRMHLVSSRDGETLDFEIKLDPEGYEIWLEARLEELVKEIRLDQKRIARRAKTARGFVFPFPRPRAGQVELIRAVEEGMEAHRPMLLQAPTGLGKTMGVLYPSLKEALARGQKVIYVTPKNSQHGVAEEAIGQLQETGAPLKSLTITAKSKMCFKNEAICNPDYCEFAKDHYTKLADNDVAAELARKKKLTAKSFRKMAQRYQVCPFELQLEAIREADTVICDYNYVFSPRPVFGGLVRAGLIIPGKPNLVIDEAHNLPARALDYYSPELSVRALEGMREGAARLPRKFRGDTQSYITDCIRIIDNCGDRSAKKAHAIAPPAEEFLRQDQELKAFLSTYLSSDVEIQSGDVVMRLSYYWSEFTGALDFVKKSIDDSSGRFFTTFTPHPGTIKITCCDASEMLKERYQDFEQVVAFSATLKPFEFYSQLAGLDAEKLITAEFASPFKNSNRKILAIPQISSKYSEREKNYPRVAEVIEKITFLQRGNYVAFFPSFEFMEKVLSCFKAGDGVHVLRQQRGMKRDDIDHVLEQLKINGLSHILFAVQGGVFSEGIDYPGNMLIGAFVIGPPLPNFDLEREKMREYYQEHYSAGFDYAYMYPAMAKAVQSAGRVIRSETDRGIIVLMDNRFIQASYVKSMPSDWFTESPEEMVSQSILKDVSDFWENGPGPTTG